MISESAPALPWFHSVGQGSDRPRPRPAANQQPIQDYDDRERNEPQPQREHRPGPAVPNWLFYLLTLVVTGLWGWGIVLSLTNQTGAKMPASLNAAFPIVLAGIYSAKAVSDRNKRGD